MSSSSQPPPKEDKSKRPDKGTRLELRVARLMMAQGLTPFINVYFRSAQEAAGISTADVDVMGCSVLPDATMLHSHVDCKSGDSAVVNRILLLQGLRLRIPPGPMLYVRPQTKIAIKRMALGEDVRVADLSEIVEREERIARPLFGDRFPSITDPRLTTEWREMRAGARQTRFGKICQYLESEFWTESHFTRVKRAIAAVQLIDSDASGAGLSGAQRAHALARAIRQLVYALLSAASQVAYFAADELVGSLREWLVTEAMPVEEYRAIVESTAQFIYEVYGDPAKGPLRTEQVFVPPPDYTDELADMLKRTVRLGTALPTIMPLADAIIERGLLGQPAVADKLMSRFQGTDIESGKAWYRGLRIFLGARRRSISEWPGWSAIEPGAGTSGAAAGTGFSS